MSVRACLCIHRVEIFASSWVFVFLFLPLFSALGNLFPVVVADGLLFLGFVLVLFLTLSVGSLLCCLLGHLLLGLFCLLVIFERARLCFGCRRICHTV